MDEGKEKRAGEQEGFLSRWARRKTEAKDDPLSNETPADGLTPAPEEMAVAPVEEIVDLPRLEDITAEGSIAQFLKKEIPEALKRAAMRQAWALDPRIRDFIEVAENQYDFNNPSSIPGFGDLPEGTDIAALLKQATGFATPDEPIANPDKPVTAIADVSDRGEENGALSEAGADQQEQAAMPAIAAADDPAVLVEPAENEEKTLSASDAAEAVEDASSLAPLRVRRHGGALPA